MNSKRGNRRRVYKKSYSINSSSSTISQRTKTILDTSYRIHLLIDVRYITNKLSRTKLFKIYNIVNRTNYQILKEEMIRYNEKVYN